MIFFIISQFLNIYFPITGSYIVPSFFNLFVAIFEIVRDQYLRNKNCLSFSVCLHISYPNATSSIIMTVNPAAKRSVPTLECAPSDISGISSSTTT